MSYTWLKKFDVELGETFPYFKITLEISNSWNINLPFYTFIVTLKIDAMDFGYYLYVGKQVNTLIEPNRTLSIESYLKVVDIHANEIRERILNISGKEQSIEVSLIANVDLFNYSNTLGPIVKRFSLEEVLEWIKKTGTLRNDFVPAPSHNALISMLYRNMDNIEKQLTIRIEDRLNKAESYIKPLITLFQKGFEALYRDVEEKVKSNYEHLMPLTELIKLATDLSKNFNQNWALASLSLVLMENVVKYAQTKLNLRPKGNMENQIKELAHKVKELGIDIDYPKLAGEWRRRHIAIHEAYETPISKEVAEESFRSVKELIEKLLPILKRPNIYVIDWSPPDAPLTKNRVIVVGNEAYYMGEPYDSWVKERSIKIESRPPSEDYHTYLEKQGITCTHKQPPSIAWLEEHALNEHNC